MAENPTGSFAVLLNEHADELVNAKFKANITELNTALSFIMDAVSIRTDSADGDIDKAALVEQITSTYAQLAADPANAQYFAIIDKIAAGIGTNVVNIFNVLSTQIAPEVEDLANSIKERAKAILLEKGQEAVANESLQPNFKVMEWDKTLNMIGGLESIHQKYESQYGYAPSGLPADLGFALQMKKRPQITQMNIHPDTKADILERFYEKAGNPSQRKAMLHLYEAVTDTYAFNAVLDTTAGRLYDSPDLPGAIAATCKAIDTLYPMLLVARKIPLNITTETQETLSKNFDALESAFDLMGLGLEAARKNYRNAVVIDKQVLNGDNMQFYKEKLSPELVTKYLRLIYKAGISVPITGISGSLIAEEAADVEAKYAEVEQEQTENAITIQQAALQEAGTEILTSYLAATPEDRLPEGCNLEQFVNANRGLINTYLTQLNASGDSNLQSLLFGFIIEVHYNGTMVKTAHQLMGQEMIRQLEINKDLQSGDMDMIDITVAAKLISKFIVDELVDIN